MTATIPQSPCVNICELNEQDVCVGCFRHIDEIAGWHQFSDTQKREIYQAIDRRERDAGVRFGEPG